MSAQHIQEFASSHAEHENRLHASQDDHEEISAHQEPCDDKDCFVKNTVITAFQSSDIIEWAFADARNAIMMPLAWNIPPTNTSSNIISILSPPTHTTVLIC